MAGKAKDQKSKHLRLVIADDSTHEQLWVMRFSRVGLIAAAVAVVALVMGLTCVLTAFTPLRTLVPGYPDAHAQKAAIANAIRIDSLENVILRWEFYSENLRRVLSGEDPMKIDSLVRRVASDSISDEVRRQFRQSDSLLRKDVTAAEQFSITASAERKLPIEGMHFFCPLKGVVSQGYDKVIHPYIDITAPANTVVTSVLDGTVVEAGWRDETGYTIILQHRGDVISVYKHNQKLLKKQGEHVTAGAPVALVGNTGSLTTGDHLHFELWYDGDPVDPTKYINF